MPRFTVPVTIEISGYIVINAETIAEARSIALSKNENGVDTDELTDSHCSSEVHINETEIIGETS